MYISGRLLPAGFSIPNACPVKTEFIRSSLVRLDSSLEQLFWAMGRMANYARCKINRISPTKKCSSRRLDCNKLSVHWSRYPGGESLAVALATLQRGESSCTWSSAFTSFQQDEVSRTREMSLMIQSRTYTILLLSSLSAFYLILNEIEIESSWIQKPFQWTANIAASSLFCKILCTMEKGKGKW